MFVEEICATVPTPADYLLTVDMRWLGPGLSLLPIGSWAKAIVHLVPDSARCASQLAGQDALVLCDVRSEKTQRSRRVALALPFSQQGRRRKRTGLQSFAATEARALLFARATVTPSAGLSRSRPAGLVPGGLSHPAGHAHRELSRSGAPPSSFRACRSRNFERRNGGKASTS